MDQALGPSGLKVNVVSIEPISTYTVLLLQIVLTGITVWFMIFIILFSPQCRYILQFVLIMVVGCHNDKILKGCLYAFMKEKNGAACFMSWYFIVLFILCLDFLYILLFINIFFFVIFQIFFSNEQLTWIKV